MGKGNLVGTRKSSRSWTLARVHRKGLIEQHLTIIVFLHILGESGEASENFPTAVTALGQFINRDIKIGCVTGLPLDNDQSWFISVQISEEVIPALLILPPK